MDEGQTKDLAATVDYRLGEEIQTGDHIDLNATVQVLQPDTLSTSGVTANTYRGWKLVKITINGKKVEKGELNTVYDLLKSLNVNSKRVVVELNKEIVNSCNYNEILLNHEDVIEIIAFVGGG